MRNDMLGTIVVLLSLLLAACNTASLAQNATQISSLSASKVNLSTPIAGSSTGEWPTYLANNGRSGYNETKTKAITTSSASKLKQLWSFNAKRPISTQPVEANGMTYWGDWNGIEHATDLSGHEVWSTNLGTTTHPEHHCEPVAVGIASTATVATVSINGKKMLVLFVGGGDQHVYALNASNGTVIWKTALGASTVPSDSFLWSSPAYFQVNVNGVKHGMVGIASKNRSFYAFDPDALDKGLVWSDTIARGGTCGECGDGSISPAAFDGRHLYVAGGHTTIGGVPCQGSLRAINPANGSFLWEKCMRDSSVLGAVTVASGIVVVEGGHELVVVESSSGKTLFTYKEPGARSLFYAAPSISAGVLYAANMDGKLYAFGS